MLENRNTVTIAASAEQVWSILTDLGNWSAWNPTIHQVDGELTPGRDVTIHVGTPEEPRSWTCTISRFAEATEFGWTFRERNRLLYGGEHIFRVEPVDGTTSRYIDVETFTGLLLLLRRHHHETVLWAGMDNMGTALKKHAEGSASTAL